MSRRARSVSPCRRGLRRPTRKRTALRRRAGLRPPDVAAAGQLFVVAAGAPEAIEAAAPLFERSDRRPSSSPRRQRPPISSSSAATFSSPRSSNRSARRWRSSARAASTGSSISNPHFDTVRRPGLQDLWRTDRRRKVRTGRFRGAPWPEGHPAHPRGRRRAARAIAAREPAARPFLTLLAHGGDELDWSAIGSSPPRMLAKVDRLIGKRCVQPDVRISERTKARMAAR